MIQTRRFVTNPWPRLARTAVLVCLAAVGACTTIGPPGGSATRVTESRAAASAAAGEYAQAARMYETLAAGASADDAARLRLLAALAWLDAGRYEPARRAYAEATAQPGGPTTLLATLVESALGVADGNADAALDALNRVANAGFNLNERLAYQGVRARALFALDRPAEAVSFLVRREYWLNEDRAVSANHQAIWDGLRATPSEVLEDARLDSEDRDVRGWLDLVAVTNPLRHEDRALRQAVLDWTRRYPNHAANAYFVPALIGDQSLGPGAAPQRIALLLPLQGRQRAAAIAIRDGFISAHIADSPIFNAPEVRVYDYSADGALLTYERAVNEGAEVVVGPLTKSAVEEMTFAAALPVPLIALNELPRDNLAPTGFYQFALAPEDEAAAVARRAALDSDRRAVALVPIGDWGERVLTSFRDALLGHGGQLLDYELYDPAETDFSTEIERVMQIRASIVRRNSVRQLLGETVQFEPRRRRDVDYIFLAAPAATARLIRPQLKFHFSGDLPVYTTTTAYTDDGRSNADLDGVRFTEIPWLIEPETAPVPAAAVYEQYWRGRPQVARLFAFGLDAYRLIGLLLVDGFEGVAAGATGELALDSDNRVRRRPAFGIIRRQGVERLSEPEISFEGDMLEPPEEISFEGDMLEPPPEWLEATGNE